MVDTWRKVLAQNWNTQANLETLQKHVAKLEERVGLLEVKSFEGSEDYYCWVLLRSLLVSNKLERLRLINDLSGDRIDKKRKELTFKETLNWLGKKNEYLDTFHHLETVIEIRHSFSHLGLPHIVRQISNKQSEEISKCLNDYGYCKTVFSAAQAIIDSEHGIRVHLAAGPADHKIAEVEPGRYLKKALEE